MLTAALFGCVVVVLTLSALDVQSHISAVAAAHAAPTATSNAQKHVHSAASNGSQLTPQQLWAFREDARDMFYHGYDAYMKHGCEHMKAAVGRPLPDAVAAALRLLCGKASRDHALFVTVSVLVRCSLPLAGLVLPPPIPRFPWDEVKPLSCVGRRWDLRERGTLDDSLGGETVVPPAHPVKTGNG
jgi:hypothetical protein